MNSSEVFLPPKINTTKSLLKNQAYDIIKSAIMNNHLKPDRIYSQEFLSQSLGISRTPVREALLQLQLEGIIQIHRGRGIQIASTTKEDMQDIIEMSDAIECKTCQLAAERIDNQVLEKLEELHILQIEEASKGNIQDFMKYDRAFHALIAETTKNKKLLENVELIHEQFLRSRIFYIYSIDNLQVIIKEHRAIIDALTQKEPLKAAEAMRLHIEGIYERAIDCIEKLNAAQD